MNKYRADSIMRALDAGLRVAYVADGRAGEAAFDAFITSGLVPAGWSTRRARGEQRVESPNGGSLRFYRSATSMRGATVDIVYLETVKAGSAIDQLADVAPALMLSTVGELVLCPYRPTVDVH